MKHFAHKLYVFFISSWQPQFQDNFSLFYSAARAASSSFLLQKAKVVCRRTPTETESAEHYYIRGIISLFAISRDHTNAHAHAEVVRL